MRANTDRTAALDFGELADHYDAGRLAHSPDYVSRTTARLGTRPGARLMDVGAGTGQLTGALLATGGDVVAVEPSRPLASRLERNLASYAASGRLRICPRLFETLQAGDLQPFGQIWSSDAWHWIDPAVGYRLAARLLTPDGLLICTWRFPVLTDPDLQRRLNAVYSRLSPDLVRDPDAHPGDVQPLLEAGRREISASGFMTIAGYWTEEHRAHIPAGSYTDLQLSFAQIARLSTGQRAEIGAGIREVAGQASVSMTIWQYTVASRPARR